MHKQHSLDLIRGGVSGHTCTMSIHLPALTRSFLSSYRVSLSSCLPLIEFHLWPTYRYTKMSTQLMEGSRLPGMSAPSCLKVLVRRVGKSIPKHADADFL